MTDTITSFQFAPTPENIALVFGTLALESADEHGYLWAEAADAWSFSAWGGLDSPLQVYRAAELVDETNFLARNWLPTTVAGRWFSGQSQLSWRRMLVGDEFVWRAVYLGSNPDLSAALVGVGDFAAGANLPSGSRRNSPVKPLIQIRGRAIGEVGDEV